MSNGKGGRIPFIPNKDEFRNVANDKRGYIVGVAGYFGVSEGCIYALQAKDPEIRAILVEARRLHHERELDLAVSLNYHFMQDYKNNPGLASLHTRYTLDKRGQSRGYRKDNDEPIDEAIEKKFDDKMNQMLDLLAPSSDLNMEESKINNETKS